MIEKPREIEHFNLLRLRSQPHGPLMTYVRCDFDERQLLGLLRNVRVLSRSGEYSLISATYQGRHINLLGTGSGPASLLTALFELAPRRLRSLLRIGACGGLLGRTTNQIVLAESSLCMDRISARLAETTRAKASMKLVEELQFKMRSDGLKCVRAIVASLDAMYLFESKLKSGKRQGAYAWDLETATTLAFGRRFSVPAASLLLVVSDSKGNSLKSYPPLRRIDFVKSAIAALTER